MNMAYATANTTVGLNLVGRIAAYRAQLADASAKRKVYRLTRAELSSLSNRDLADLGIGRSQIRGIALEAAYGA